ncbi:MAG: DUF1570 domain-containing protein [Planctomycetota bacterium]
MHPRSQIAARPLLVFSAWVLLTLPALAGGPAKFMMTATVGGKQVEGQPLSWSSSEMLLYGRDGALHEFNTRSAEGAKKSAPRFRAYSSSELRDRLQEEFGRGWAVTVSRHFVVVHPRGRWVEWAQRLEKLYQSFHSYMRVRGIRVERPRVPLIAVVFRNKGDYHRYSAKSGTPLHPNTLGHYDSESNRIFLFDASGKADASWSVNAETIIHEATHQTAYNVGVHRRFAEQPRWLVEGLAMMFEVRGVWNARSSDTQADRINDYRLRDFRAAKDRMGGKGLAGLVASDNLFRSDPLGAYANAWALSFYLTETRPREYDRYLQKVAAREPFTRYPGRKRVSDFVSVFGSDFELLAAQMERFFEELQ